MREVRVRFTGGLTFEEGVRDILWPLASRFRFVESETPDVVIFGPYGGYVPPGPFLRVGYFCENMRPDLQICDWAFGVDRETDLPHPRYMQIRWHGLDPALLQSKRAAGAAPERFCNFVYGVPVPLRERFFALLSRYKRVDAPGRSMNNMPSFDGDAPDLSRWERKRRFLSRYKFTIAFENSSYPGYHTEKLTDPMLAGSLPIYWGDAHAGDVFNTASFIDAHEILGRSDGAIDRIVRRRPVHMQPAPSLGERLLNKVAVRLKPVIDSVRYRDLQRLVDRVVALDSDDHLYAQYAAQPWLRGDAARDVAAIAERWTQIFDSALEAPGRRS